MNANVVLLKTESDADPCAQDHARINESLRARERLLTASARASSLLLLSGASSRFLPRSTWPQL